MTSKKYFTILGLGCALVYGIHFTLLHTEIIQYNWKHFNVLDIAVFAIFFLSGLIITPGFKQEAEKFVTRFMVTTTVQLLSMLSIIAAILYTKQPNGRQIAFSLIGVFLMLLVVQTTMLIRNMKSKK